MLAELDIRSRGIQDLGRLHNPEIGWMAGIGRFEALYGRDPERLITLALRWVPNLAIPGIIDISEKTLDTLESLQATEPNPEWEVFWPGQIIHEWRNGFTPQERIKELEAQGWPVFINPQGQRELRYYGGGDETPGYMIAVATLGRAKEAVFSSEGKRDEYLGKKWSSVKAAYSHQARIADTKGNGLIVDNPQNPNGLYHHTERDSQYGFDLEDGTRPDSPFFYFKNNTIFLGSLPEFGWMAQMAGENDLVSEANERYRFGRERFIEMFWVPDWGYPTPLVFGPDQRKADFISSEAMDGLYYGIFDHDQARQVVSRFMQPDILTPFGPRSRSIHSRRHFINGSKAYWSGAVWPLDCGIAAEGLERYGFNHEANILDQALSALVGRKGNVELGAVDRLNRLYDYKEEGIKVACNPHLFTLGAVLARTAYPRQTVEHYLEEKRSKIFSLQQTAA